MDDEEEDVVEPLKVQILVPKKTKKSILKNKGTSIFISAEDDPFCKPKVLGRESKLPCLLKNIDGKMIHQAENELGSSKEVIFRKSVSQVSPLEILLSPPASAILNRPSKDSHQRKSCMKRPSFDLADPKLRPSRSSKLELVNIGHIDGKMLQHKKRGSMEHKVEGGLAVASSDSDNEASSHNIFGGHGAEMSEELKMKLGFSEDGVVEEPKLKNTQSLGLHKKQSILKIPSKTGIDKKQSMKESGFKEEASKLKSKKSVVFNCTM